MESRDLSIRRFASEAAQEITSLEHSKLFRTVAALLFRPGLLTVEYFSGRRVRYVKPFALTLAVLALHLFAFSVSNTSSMYDVGKVIATQKSMLGSQGNEAARPIEAGIRKESAERGVNPRYVEQEINDKWVRNSSFLQIPLIVVLALLLQLVHLSSRRYFVEHLVFSMHVISFTGLTVVMMWPIYYFRGTELTAAAAAISFAKFIIDATWIVIATRTFYGRSLGKSLLLGLISYVGYYLVFFAMSQLALILALRSTFAGP